MGAYFYRAFFIYEMMVICEKIVLNWLFLVKMFKKCLTNVKKMY